MKGIKYILPLAAAFALASCAKEPGKEVVPEVNPNEGKELIAFSQEGDAMTKGLMTKAGFSANTKIVMRFKAEGNTPVRYSQAVATASAQLTGEALSSDWCYTDYSYTEPHSHVTYNSGQERYWDDAFGRESQITVYAVAIPNKNSDELLSNTILNTNGTTTETFGTTNPNWYKITDGTENNTIACY